MAQVEKPRVLANDFSLRQTRKEEVALPRIQVVLSRDRLGIEPQ